MGKAVWKPGTVLYPVPVVMVSCGTEEKGNIITVAWTGTINSDPAMTYVSIRPSRHSFELIQNSGEFVINLVNKDLAYACDFCGVKSGRDMDKFKELNLTAKKGEKVDAPIIYESPVNIECKVKEIIPLGTHHMFLAEVVSVSVSDEYLDETGKFHFNDTEPVCYSHGAYFTLGKQLGTFGYSVKKPKKAKKKK
ncbi:flavin reductase family protein [Anaerotignum propionicum]|jgi:flavin reductase (DIM6/NTAB) family NADH-FMN oxidoreductase RutF|uniref:Flavoredoxin n=1 Tax=Anaerotignum propionicum DSM 1682 TaxID=991789 RepID=A0A0X8V8L4_ANAPI|nr:flavin reductase family protein [Anaerotignum propionicum]AMJ40131.1 flavoredoxin [Anaerotignum propionicum DSM 1682]SHF13237.1 NADH-FMN oxidoreductase RutF, flavin reductase (DIM6/NTAB) family [[Clostridium] propionicum DSM 1682] [Anaerotignum propionicum DSM 1682]